MTAGKTDGTTTAPPPAAARPRPRRPPALRAAALLATAAAASSSSSSSAPARRCVAFSPPPAAACPAPLGGGAVVVSAGRPLPLRRRSRPRVEGGSPPPPPLLRMSPPSSGGGGGGTSSSEEDPSEKLELYLSTDDLRSAIRHLKSNPDLPITEDLFGRIFDAIEIRTSEAEENGVNTRLTPPGGMMEYPPESPARSEMTDMYRTLRSMGELRVFGAAGRDGRPYPAGGSNVVTPVLLERITDLSMTALTPKPTNTLLLAGAGLALAECVVSLSTGIDLNFLVLSTLFLAFMDRLLVNGAVFETAMRILMPEYGRKVLRHEAGHFLCAYLLGCPVEGCVLSSWAALRDSRFGGRRTSVSAGTSFFDPDLSDEINGRRALTRSSIDRYSVIVMGGIAAEAIEFGRADGGAGDEMALVRFLTNVNPRGGGARAWDSDLIKNQARWGAVQAVLLLRRYRVCYDALVDALERGGDLGRCVLAIERAARENGIEPMNEPIGYVLDGGLYGEWATAPTPGREEEGGGGSAAVPAAGSAASDGTATGGGAQNGTSVSTAEPSPDGGIESSKEALSQYRRLMEEKLKKIDAQLSDIKEDTSN